MIEINLFNIIGVAVIGVMIAFWYAPIQKSKRYLIDLLPNYLSSLTGKVLNCSKCSSFILGLVLFIDIPAAALSALLGFTIQFLITYIEAWYESGGN